MRFITGIFDKLQKHPKRVVFPDGKDPRIIQTARQFFVLRMGIPILLGGRSEILHIADEMGVSTESVRINIRKLKKTITSVANYKVPNSDTIGAKLDPETYLKLQKLVTANNAIS